jgi:hypothetical protein
MTGSFRSDSAMSTKGRPKVSDRSATRAESSLRMCVLELIAQRMDGVQAERIEVELGEPHLGVLENVLTYRAGRFDRPG